MKELKKIDEKITFLKKQKSNVMGTQTEVYARIVGYYRSVRNWNKGKREEYNVRLNFSKLNPGENTLPKNLETVSSSNMTNKVNIEATKKYQYFYRTTCPNCPPVHTFLKELDLDGQHINVDENDGMALASKNDVMSAPTVILRDNNDKEIYRANNVELLKNAFNKVKIAG